MINLTAQGSGYYIVSVNGTDTTQHVTEREAIESAVNQEQSNPAAVVAYRHDYIVRVEEVADPVPTPTPTPVASLFEINQQTLPTFFPFFRGPDNGTNKWEAEWLTDGTLRYYRWANVEGSDRSGFTFDPNTLLPAAFSTYANNTFYLRFRINVTQGMGNSMTSEGGMKWFIFGGPGLADGLSRMIFWFRTGLWFDPNTGAVIAGSENETTLLMSQGIGPQVKARFPNGQPVDVQLAFKYGADGFMSIYVNNNDQANPTATLACPNWTFPESWTGGHWGNIETDNSIANQTGIFDIRDAQFGVEFDPNWSV